MTSASQEIFPFAAPPEPYQPVDAAVVFFCVSSFSISSASLQPKGSQTVVLGPAGIPDSLQGIVGPFSLSLKSVHWSFPELTCHVMPQQTEWMTIECMTIELYSIKIFA